MKNVIEDNVIVVYIAISPKPLYAIYIYNSDVYTDEALGGANLRMIEIGRKVRQIIIVTMPRSTL